MVTTPATVQRFRDDGVDDTWMERETLDFQGWSKFAVEADFGVGPFQNPGLGVTLSALALNWHSLTITGKSLEILEISSISSTIFYFFRFLIFKTQLSADARCARCAKKKINRCLRSVYTVINENLQNFLWKAF